MDIKVSSIEKSAAPKSQSGIKAKTAAMVERLSPIQSLISQAIVGRSQVKSSIIF